MDVINVLMVEDNPGDIRLTQETIKRNKLQMNLEVVMDGEAAMAFLKKEGIYADKFKPDLILLDLNLPKLDGREVLAKIKTDPGLLAIPVVVLTTSSSDEDILKSYNLHANLYITKPLDLKQFVKMISNLDEFWLAFVKFPSRVKK